MPKCFVEPQSTADVAAAVYVLSLGAQKSDFGPECQFAIKSGGHTPQAGWANQAGGVTIDLAALNSVNVSADKTLTKVGPGNRWVNVYSILDPMNLAIPGGRVADVGVGGLTTGGTLTAMAYSPLRAD